MTERPHVALLVETSTAYGRALLNGITRYLRTHPPWSVFLEERELSAAMPRWLKTWRGHGILCRSLDAPLARHCRRLKVPVVNLNDIQTGLDFPLIRSDDEAIGRLAAEHLLERGFRHFGFCGFQGQAWALRRRGGFLERVHAAAAACAVFESPGRGRYSHPWEQEQAAIGKWLDNMPRPAGIMACNDVRGQQVLDACQRVNLAVPEEVAVIGVDDDALLCQLCDPPLSSVVPNPERIGYEAAELLARLMAGKKADQLERSVPPLGVTTRQSTDVLAIGDPHVAAAVRYIRENACQGAKVADVLQRVPVARTILERKFRKYLGRSPQAEIRAVQLKRVRQLLGETNLTLERIAHLAGFDHPEYMSVAFKRATGQTPGQYRQRVR